MMGLGVMSAFLGRDKGQVPALLACAKQAAADVLCVQEVMEHELADLRNAYRFVRFVPMTQFEGNGTMGLALCTNLVVSEVREEYYMGNATLLPIFDESTPDQVNNTKRRPLLTCVLHTEGGLYCVGTTHFLYSKGGVSHTGHLKAMRALARLLPARPRLILCGAMVTPRDGSLYDEFVQRSGMRDWVPRSITCTLDKTLHKLAPQLRSREMPPVVVDYIFGTGYSPEELVQQYEGVSDHTPLFAVAQ